MTDLGLAHELLELAPDDVHVDRDAGVLEREQADAHGAADEVRPVGRRPLGEERGEGRVLDGQAVDEDAVAIQPDARAGDGIRHRTDRADGSDIGHDVRLHDPNGAGYP